MSEDQRNWIPDTPNMEIRYPLKGNAELVITTYDTGKRSSPVDITITGLSRQDVNALSESLILGSLLVAGGEEERELAIALADAEAYTPRPDDLPRRGAANRGGDGDNGHKKSSKPARMPHTSGSKPVEGAITRKRITDDERTEAIALLLDVSPNGLSRSDIIERTGITERLWTPTVKYMIDENLWRVEGVKRGARYFAND